MSGVGKGEEAAALSSSSDPFEHLQLVCSSKTFENSTTLKNLLIYLFRRRNDAVNEYTIAVETLNRRPDFDPQIDATVRVQISRLRRRLKEFYLSEGRSTGIRLTIPLGTHQLMVDGDSTSVTLRDNPAMVRFQASPLIEGNPPPPQKPSRKGLALTVALGCLVMLLATICFADTEPVVLQVVVSTLQKTLK